MHIIEYSTCWECKQIKDKLVCFDGLEKWQDNAEICLDCLIAAQQGVHPTVLPVREIEVMCPNCNLVFDVKLPESHSG